MLSDDKVIEIFYMADRSCIILRKLKLAGTLCSVSSTVSYI